MTRLTKTMAKKKPRCNNCINIDAHINFYLTGKSIKKNNKNKNNVQAPT
jgi:hypothetical protein